MDPLVIIAIFGLGTLTLIAFGIYQFTTRDKKIVAERVETYASIEEEAALAAEADLNKENFATKLTNLILGRGYMERVEATLARADLPMRASEYVFLRLGIAVAAYIVGHSFLGYVHSGILLAAIGYFVPSVFVYLQTQRRREKFVRQLADALLLLTNSLRAGYSFFKGLELVAQEMDDPIRKELNRMLHAVTLGATMDDAMTSLAKRINSADLDIVVSAYLVQKDVGGNLTEIMEKVAETIRERLRIEGEVRVLTAQGRLSGLVVGLLPFAVFFAIFLQNPSYFDVMIGPPKFGFFGGFQVPLGVLLMCGAVVLQVIGGIVIYRLVSIKI